MAKKRTEKLLVKTDNALIDGGYSMTLSQIKLFLFMLAAVKKSGKKKKYQVFVSDLLDIEMEKKGGPLTISLTTEYNRASSILLSLQKKMVNIPSKVKKGLIDRIQLIGSVTYDPKLKLGYFYFEIHKDLKPYLLDLENRFTVYDIRNVLSAKSYFTIRMYMILKSFVGLGQREIEIETLKEMLGIRGKYKLYGDVKRYCILQAQRELKKHSDIYFTFKEKYKGRRVWSITFTIKLKEQKRLFDPDPDRREVSPIPYEQWTQGKGETG